MSNDIRIIKFETLIKDINNMILPTSSAMEGDPSIIGSAFIRMTRMMVNNYENNVYKNNGYKNKSMLLIYDYNKLNDYGKIILNCSSSNLLSWKSNYDEDNLKNDRERIDAAKEFIKCCREADSKDYTYNFIFWAMMVLAVDKTDQEKNLSLICDFARMLRVSDSEMLDIFHVIKTIFHKENEKYNFINNDIYKHFRSVLNLYNDKYEDDDEVIVINLDKK